MSTKATNQISAPGILDTIPELEGYPGANPSLEYQNQFPPRKLAAPAPGLRCPHCDSIVYSRRHKLCGVCSQELPDSFAFSPEASRRLERILRSESSIGSTIAARRAGT